MFPLFFLLIIGVPEFCCIRSGVFQKNRKFVKSALFGGLEIFFPRNNKEARWPNMSRLCKTCGFNTRREKRAGETPLSPSEAQPWHNMDLLVNF